MKVRLEKDEWYPVYTLEPIESEYGSIVEVDEELVQRVRAWVAEGEALHEILSKIEDRI